MVEAFKNAEALIDYYKKQFKAKYNRDQIIPRSKVKYPLKDALKDFKLAELKLLIDFYLKTEKRPTLTAFAYEYADIYEEYEFQKAQVAERNALRRQTEENVRKFRERYGK